MTYKPAALCSGVYSLLTLPKQHFCQGFWLLVVLAKLHSCVMKVNILVFPLHTTTGWWTVVGKIAVVYTCVHHILSSD